MKYVGGKSKLGKRIAASIAERRGDLAYWEPFCGSLAVSRYVPGPGVLSDFCAPLIALYRAVAAGWDPPEQIDEPTYRAARELPDSDPMKAFAGFGQSFGAKWFGGYARRKSGNRNDAGECRRALLRDVPAVVRQGHVFEHGSFFEVRPRSGFLLYLDPPYASTLGYGAVGVFDSAAFNVRAQEWRAAGSVVLISEYACPIGRELWSAEQITSVDKPRAGGRDLRVERLFEV